MANMTSLSCGMVRCESLKSSRIKLLLISGKSLPDVKRQEASTKQANRRKMHIQALKIYGCIFVLFSFSVVTLSFVFIMMENQRSAAIGSFIYFLNHVGNPVIYYALIDTFRREVNTYFRRVLHCFSKKWQTCN